MLLGDREMSEKKNILFVMTTMRTGGIATSVLNLLNELAKLPYYSVTLMLFDIESIREVEIDKSINILPAGVLLGVIPISQEEVREKSQVLAMNRLVAGGLAKYVSQDLAYKFLFRNIKIGSSWDIAISCTQSAPKHHLYGGCNEFVLNKIKAFKKIAFIHCDYITYGLSSAYSRKIYEKFDAIATVSDSVRNGFLKAEPGLGCKTYTVYNCHDYKRIEELANDSPIEYNSNLLNIVTIARIAEEKGHLRVLEIMRRLKDDGYLFRWHVVGGGDANTVSLLKKTAIDNGLNDYVIFYGEQKNPYRYLKNAQALLVPSFHEAAPMVYGEAELLGVPIIATRTVSADELVLQRKIGVVCDNTGEGIYNELKRIICNPGILFEYRNNGQKKLSNELALNQFLEMIRSV